MSVFQQIFSAEFVAMWLRVATPLLFASLGAVICEKSGVVNLGLEGIMLCSALAGVIGSAYTNSLFGGFICGIAMGLIKDADHHRVAVLSDIQGLEDFLGDMDFKVAGTSEGITAIQMDIKIKGIDEEILTKALEQARLGRLFILDKMLSVLPAPRKDLSKWAPKIVSFSIDPDKIRDVIGSGGKTINKIIDETGVKIDINDEGQIFIASNDMDAIAKARTIVENIVRDVEVGDVYEGKVVKIMENDKGQFGASVNFAPGKDGMIHISKLSKERVDKVTDVVNVGDIVLVKVI